MSADVLRRLLRSPADIAACCREADFGTAHLKLLAQVDRVFVSAVEWNSCHAGSLPL